MGKRADGFYPTDPYATEGLRCFLARRYPITLRGTWVDPCAGYGALLEGLQIALDKRRAIELHKRHRPELGRRVLPDSLRIGDGLALPWHGQHVVMNPDFDNDVMASFVARALDRQEQQGGLVCCLALATFWHSDAFRPKGLALPKPHHILVPAQRVSCDGTGRGDMRAIDWLVWSAGAPFTSTETVWLPPSAPSAALIAEHRRLSLLGAA